MKSFYGIVLVIFFIVTLSAAQYDFTREEIERMLAKISPVGSSRIVSGHNAVDGEFPHQLLLLSFSLATDANPSRLCGASLIGAQWSLTAAHCLRGTNLLGLDALLGKFTVVGGTVDRITLGLNSQSQTVLAVGNAITHPQYDATTIEYDIGVLKLNTPFTITDYVYPISLPTSTFDDQSYVNQTVTVSGWGHTKTDGLTSPQILQWTNLELISNDDCADQSGPDFPIPTSFCCQGATLPLTSICQGDSGGPVTLNINNQLIQIGINSYTIYACDLGFPTGHVKVAMFRQWIATKTGI